MLCRKSVAWQQRHISQYAAYRLLRRRSTSQKFVPQTYLRKFSSTIACGLRPRSVRFSGKVRRRGARRTFWRPLRAKHLHFTCKQFRRVLQRSARAARIRPRHRVTRANLRR